MTVPTETYRVSYQSSGTVFAVPFHFLANSEILATNETAQGVVTTWVEGTDYTLTGAGD